MKPLGDHAFRRYIAAQIERAIALNETGSSIK